LISFIKILGFCRGGGRERGGEGRGEERGKKKRTLEDRIGCTILSSSDPTNYM